MSELKNDRYLRALLRQPVDVTPRVDDAPGRALSA
ncbi:Uroporphyrinogen decarboxylase [Morganella morganii]|nr:Uroporphyrinogen decarboxylase [Morganella morganii]